MTGIGKLKYSEETEQRISLLNEAEKTVSRATGRTTRMDDEFIQMLYNRHGEWVKIYDHYPSHSADNMILNKVIARMNLEHPSDVFEVDRMNGPHPRMRITKSVRDYVNERLQEINKQLKDLRNNEMDD